MSVENAKECKKIRFVVNAVRDITWWKKKPHLSRSEHRGILNKKVYKITIEPVNIEK